MKQIIAFFLCLAVLYSCGKGSSDNTVNEEEITEVVKKPIYKYGYNLDNFNVIQDTIKSGESFGVILDRHHIFYPKINEIAIKIKDTFDVRRVRAGKPYTILASKDSLEKAQVFIYNHDKINATIVDFKDSIISAKRYKKPIKIVERVARGKIYSNLSNTMDSLHFNPNLTWAVADIYAWTLDFYKLQKGDTFKLVFEEKYIEDSIFAGYGKIKSAVFNHKGNDLYAFRFVADSIKGIPEYYDEKGNMLRSFFLKAPIKFQYRISSRYNLRRRIAFYGNRVRPHKGTDFAANVGTPIIATASGTVVASERRGGNGNYVKIKHNNTYTTQYLHMRKRSVRKGQYVKQGQVIGTVGMTGNTSGPHVCYRFWKNGRQVDPFSPKIKLPEAEPLKKSLKPAYLKFIKPLQEQLNQIQITSQNTSINQTIAQN